MRKNKRGIEISFNVMFSVILIVATIAIAFYVISAFLGTKKCVEVNLFYENLEEHITNAWSSRIHQGKCCSAILPSNIELVCFGNSTQTPAREDKEQYEKLAKYNKKSNVFLYPPENACETGSKKIAHFKTDEFFCVPVKNNKINIKTRMSEFDSLVTISRE